MLEAQRELAAAEGLFCQPESATTLAALKKLVAAGRIKSGDGSVVSSSPEAASRRPTSSTRSRSRSTAWPSTGSRRVWPPCAARSSLSDQELEDLVPVREEGRRPARVEEDDLVRRLEEARLDEVDEADHGLGRIDRVEDDAFRLEDEPDDVGDGLVDDPIALPDVFVEDDDVVRPDVQAEAEGLVRGPGDLQDVVRRRALRVRNADADDAASRVRALAPTTSPACVPPEPVEWTT